MDDKIGLILFKKSGLQNLLEYFRIPLPDMQLRVKSF